MYATKSNREFELMYRENSRINLELALMDGNLELAKCLEDYMALKNDDPYRAYREYQKSHKRKEEKIKHVKYIKEVEYIKIIG